MTRRVLHLLPSLAPSFAASQVALLLSELPGEEFEQHVAVLRLPPVAHGLLTIEDRAAFELNQRFAWDPFTWLKLRRLFKRLSPDVVCPWGSEAAAWAGAVGAAGVIRPADALPSGVALPPTGSASREELGLPATGRIIATVARLAPDRRVKDLLWAFDALRVLYDDLMMVVVGDGPQRAELERFAQLACDGERILFLGTRHDVPALLPHFDVFWTADPRHSRAATLEAMAAGRPIVCDESDWCAEHLESVLAVPARDRAKRAIATRRLLDEPETSSQLGQAARKQAEQAYSPVRMAAAYRAAYVGG